MLAVDISAFKLADHLLLTRIHEHLASMSFAQLGELYYLVEGFDQQSQSQSGSGFSKVEKHLLRLMRLVIRSRFPHIEALIDLGPGGKASAETVSLPLVKTTKCKEYHVLDCSGEALVAAHDVVAEHVPHVRIRTQRADFIRNTVRVEAGFPRGIPLLGSTIGNLPVARFDEFPYAAYVQYLRRLRKMVGVSGFLLIGWHSAGSEEEALAPYRGEDARHFLEAPLRVLRAWEGTGFDSENWEVNPEWHPASHCVSHGFRARKACDVTFGAESYSYEAGHRLVFNLSFKIPPEVMLKIVLAAGFVPVSLFDEPNYHLWLLR